MKRDVREISPREQKLIHLLVTELCRHANFPNENEEEELYQYAWEVLLSNRALIQRLRKTAEQKGWEQVAESIQDALARMKREEQERCYRRKSLDQTLNDETTVTRLELLTAPHGDVQNSVCFRDYLRQQELDVQYMAYGLIGGDTFREIRSRYHWSRSHTLLICRKLRRKMGEYLEI